MRKYSVNGNAQYLRLVEIELGHLPRDVRRGVLDSLQEEMETRDQGSVEEAIERYGEPREIARAASSSYGVESSSLPHLHTVILQCLLVSFGGLVLPVVGTMAGIILVARSRMWSASEKRATLITPVVVALLCGAAVWLQRVFPPPSPTPFEGPTLPTAETFSTASIVTVAAFVVSGIVLFLLAVRRYRRVGRVIGDS